MIYSSIVFHIVHVFNYYKFSALQLHQYKWFILCNQIIVTNNLICYCYMYIFSHNKCHQAEFQFFIFWRTSCRLESSGWLAFPKRLWLGKWRLRRACGELTMVHKSSKEFLCSATRDAGSWSTIIRISNCSCHSSMHFFHISWEFLFSGQLVLVRPETQKVSHFSRGPQSARLGLRWQEVGGWLVGTQVTSMVGRPTVPSTLPTTSTSSTPAGYRCYWTETTSTSSYSSSFSANP